MVWNIYFQAEGNIRIDPKYISVHFQFVPGAQNQPLLPQLCHGAAVLCHAVVPAATPLHGMLSGTVCPWLQWHRRVCWNPVGSDISVKSADWFEITKRFGSRAVVKWKRLTVCKETGLPLIDPAEANSPQQQTWPWDFSDQRSCLWFLAFHC